MSEEAAKIRAMPAGFYRTLAEAIVNSDPVIRIFAACEWDELNDDGKEWVAAIVRETLATATETRQ